MTRTRVLVVDDSALFRELIAEILNSTSDLQVVGTARDAQKAWEAIELLRPDVVTLDVEMPGVDGISFLRRLMLERPMPVVMVSTLAQRSSATGIRALEAGAIDLIEKPRIDLRTRTLHMADELIEKVRGAARARLRPRKFVSPSNMPPPRTIRASLQSTPPGGRGSVAMASGDARGLSSNVANAATSTARQSLLPSPALEARSRPMVARASRAPSAVGSSGRPGRLGQAVPSRPVARRRTLVAIGASTGGTEALLLTLRSLPADAPPIIIVQHMPRSFTNSFAKRLNSLCTIEVKEAEDRDLVVPGRALLAPGGRQMRLQRSGRDFLVRITDDPPVGLHKPSVDVLFESCARQAGASCMGILLTGMGADGAYGLGEMMRAGAQTVAQDEHTCVVFGMPKEAIERGFAQRVLPLDRIARAITNP